MREDKSALLQVFATIARGRKRYHHESNRVALFKGAQLNGLLSREYIRINARSVKIERYKTSRTARNPAKITLERKNHRPYGDAEVKLVSDREIL